MFFDHRWKRSSDLQDLMHIIQEREENAPQDLPATRPGRLSIPPLDSHQPSSSFLWTLPRRLWSFSTSVMLGEKEDKSECPLILQLPAEIREQIWQYALGSRLLHITRAERKLLALECPSQCPQTVNASASPCWGLLNRNTRMFPGYYLRPSPGNAALPTKLLALPQTCRLM